jgi:hypothetical protein
MALQIVLFSKRINTSFFNLQVPPLCQESRDMARNKGEMSPGLSLRAAISRLVGEGGAARKITRQIHHFKHTSFLIGLPSYLLIMTLCRGKSVTAAWTPSTHKYKHDPGSWHITQRKCRQTRSPCHLNTHRQVSFLGVSAEHNTSSSLVDHEAMVQTKNKWREQAWMRGECVMASHAGPRSPLRPLLMLLHIGELSVVSVRAREPSVTRSPHQKNSSAPGL